jgi:hypothetical protein
MADAMARVLRSWQGAAAFWGRQSGPALKAAAVPAALALALYLLGMLGGGRP